MLSTTPATIIMMPKFTERRCRRRTRGSAEHAQNNHDGPFLGLPAVRPMITRRGGVGNPATLTAVWTTCRSRYATLVRMTGPAGFDRGQRSRSVVFRSVVSAWPWVPTPLREPRRSIHRNGRRLETVVRESVDFPDSEVSARAAARHVEPHRRSCPLPLPMKQDWSLLAMVRRWCRRRSHQASWVGAPTRR
jgi:hypothetical protein